MKVLHSPLFPCKSEVKEKNIGISDLDLRQRVEAVKFSEGWGIFNKRRRFWADDKEKEEIKEKAKDFKEYGGEITGRTWHSTTPIDLELELTTACNQKCIHCWSECGHKGEEIDLEKAHSLIKEFRRSGGQRLLLTGGEPLLYSGLREVMQVSRREGIRDFSIVTNGTRINPEIAGFLAESFHYVNISIHGHNPEVHDNITQKPGSFIRAIDGIRELRRRKVDILIYFTVMEENFESVPEMFGLARKLGVKGIRFKPVNPDGRAKEIAHMTPEGMAFLSSYLSQASKNEGVRIIDSEVYRSAYEDGNNDSRFYGCEALRTIVYVAADGQVYPCNLLFWVPLGNIYEINLQEFWDSQRAVDFRDSAIKKGTQKNCESCGAFCRKELKEGDTVCK